MSKFAFILHAVIAKDVAFKYPVLKFLPDSLIEKVIRHISPRVLSHIDGVKSLTGAETEGWFVGCPLTTKQLIEDDPAVSIRKIVECGKIAQELGAEVVGLGAYTAIVGDAGKSIAAALDIGVTTGNSYTIVTAVEGAINAAEAMGINPKDVRAAVLGATGSIGKACARLLAGKVAEIDVVGRRDHATERVVTELRDAGIDNVRALTDIPKALAASDIVITVTSAISDVVPAEALRPGAVICDVARPRDVSRAVALKRDDVLVIEGGVVDVPGDVDFHFEFGFPPKTAYACMAETMMLGLEGMTDDYSIGRDIAPDQVDEISGLAQKHGFKLAGFRSFERNVDPAFIQKTRERAEKARAKAGITV